MLIKAMTCHGDFERALRRRRLLSVGLLALGLMGLGCYFLLVKDSDALPEFARGFYLGASSGITAGALVLLIRTQYLITHPKAKQEAKVVEQDERQKAILNRSFLSAGMVTFFLCAGAMFVLVAVSRPAALAVFCVIVVYSLSWLGANAYYERKL